MFLKTGGRTADDIISWLTKKTGPPALELKSVDEAKAFIEAHNVVVVGFFKDQTSEQAKKYLTVASITDDQQFGITSDEAVFAEYGAECGNVILFKKVKIIFQIIYQIFIID